MAEYTIKYFGNFEVDEKDESFDIETVLEQDGEQKDVSIIMNCMRRQNNT